MKVLGLLLVFALSTGCTTGAVRRISVDGLGTIEREAPPRPEYDVDGSLRCADLRRHGCMITCGASNTQLRGAVVCGALDRLIESGENRRRNCG